MTVEELKRADRDVIGQYVELKPENGHWKARCPFHDDANPSMVVYGDGRGFHCFACQANGDVFDFLKRHDGLEFADAKRHLEEFVGVSNQTPEVVARYPYTDEQGLLLFEVLRYFPKSFRQRRPDGKGGWEWKLGDVRKPLYRLPDVLKAERVFVVEGEKDVEALEGLGFVATTCCGGASQSWRSEWTDALTGRSVVVIPDSDQPGRKHAAKVRDALLGAADEVLVVELPDEHKDTSDWINAGATAEDFKRVVAEARNRADEPEREWWDSIPSIDDLKPQPVKWLIKPILPDGGFVLAAGTPGSYKSFIALDIARAVATGESFAQLGRSVQRDVLYIDLENPGNVIASRKNVLGIRQAPRLKYWGRWTPQPFFGIDSPELRKYAAAVKPLIVFDSLVRFHKGNENDAGEMAIAMGHFLELTKAGATVLLLHHAGKDESKNVRGSTELEGAPDLAYRVSRTDDRAVRLFQFKNRFGEEASFDLRLGEFGFECLGGPRLDEG